MSNKFIVPCLWFNDQAEQAANFYTQLFPEGRVTAVSHYPESGGNPSGKPPGSVLTVEFEIAGQSFTALNGGPHFVINSSISFIVLVQTTNEAERLFAALAEGGKVLMPLERYPWSERYGWVADRFGVSWQVMTGRGSPEGSAIVPCLMFSDALQGKAEQAIQTYLRIFPDSRVAFLERFAAGEGPEGTIKHGRFVLSGQEMAALDSPISHGFTFNEGVSLQVMCDDQQTIDHYWSKLSEGWEQGPCGWLKDAFGISWQIVPTLMSEWMTCKDVAARDRAFRVMLQMKKLEIAPLQAALSGA